MSEGAETGTGKGMVGEVAQGSRNELFLRRLRKDTGLEGDASRVSASMAGQEAA